MTNVILVDEKDNEVGQMEKLEAHKVGALHRAFSVLIMNSKGERNLNVPHFPLFLPFSWNMDGMDII